MITELTRTCAGAVSALPPDTSIGIVTNGSDVYPGEYAPGRWSKTFSVRLVGELK